MSESLKKIQITTSSEFPQENIIEGIGSWVHAAWIAL